ncbi:MAG TPA: phosphotransferase [Syntrophales bacterium]|nr:phosphotransferase [Syntrophales bacterium]HPI55793.1 phosphotransferase [Syntrophales bacterium]HPN23715.1 phosphotransferase [Syntrophales bacterium]HQM27759.1 phosphotransferase [Syntrophales bacterium]
MKQHWAELGFPGDRSPNLSFFKVGGNPWEEGRINFLVFDVGQSEPLLFVKIVRDSTSNPAIRREYTIMKRLAEDEALSPYLPVPVHLVNISGRDMLLQRVCHGKRMISLLSGSPFLQFQKTILSMNFRRALEFVETLNTRQRKRLTEAEFRESIVDPLKLFYDQYEDSKEKKMRFTELTERLVAQMDGAFWVTPIHGDYSATNIFIESDGRVKIIDWETVREEGLPFWDLFYFMSKYIHNMKIYPNNRWDRVLSIYMGRGWLSQLVHGTVDEYCRKTGFDMSLGRLIFPLHFLNKATIKNDMKGRDAAQPWIRLFELSTQNLDQLCF